MTQKKYHTTAYKYYNIIRITIMSSNYMDYIIIRLLNYNFIGYSGGGKK